MNAISRNFFLIALIILSTSSKPKSSDGVFESGDAFLSIPDSKALRSLQSVDSTDTVVYHSRSLPLGYLKDINATLIAKDDGSVSLIDSRSHIPIWSFMSGSPHYSSCGTVSMLGKGFNRNRTYNICVGDDGYLHEQVRLSNGIWTDKILVSVQEFFSRPQILSSGILAQMSKSTTLILVDVHTGNIVHMLPENQSNAKVQNSENVLAFWDEDMIHKTELLLFIRSDYTLKALSPNMSEILCTMEYFDISVSRYFPEPKDEKICNNSYLLHHGGWVILSPQASIESKITGQSYEGLDCEIGEECFMQALEHSKQHFPDRLDDSQDCGIGGKCLAQRLELDRAVANKLPSVNCESGRCLAHREGISVHNLMHNLHVQPRATYNPVVPYLILFVIAIILFGGILYFTQSIGQSSGGLRQQQFLVTRKRKNKKGAKHRYAINNKDEHCASSSHIKHTSGADDYEINEHLDSHMNDKISHIYASDASELCNGRWIGKLFIYETEIAKGSNGTILYEGIFDRRRVAVKRLVRAHNDIAFKEIDNLILSDRHPNIVRWYGVEQDLDFIYISLERCTCSLNDLIQLHSDRCSDSSSFDNLDSMRHYNTQMKSTMEFTKNLELWKANGYPSRLLLKLMRDMVLGLTHLHDLGIIHRDLKPHNVLLSDEGTLCAKLSDMGISKHLSTDMSALSNHATGYGSSGWQAPERLQHGRQTRAVDLFSLGCVLFFCITGGRHPFGDCLERDINIVRNHVDLFLVEHIPEAVDLLSHLLKPDPEQRPRAKEVLHHPFFWNSETRLSFLRDASDRVEAEDRESESVILKALESTAQVIFGGSWDTKLDTKFLQDLRRYRKYKYDSICDLLRVIRNKLSHYRDLQPEIKELLGPMPTGFDSYFASLFPQLLIEVYKVVCKYCKDEECFWKYFNTDPNATFVYQAVYS